ncbi:hypothetical protein [Spongiimicrobium salis]|uniref:hypothetical protein n=1 Tax=Spongiimicrobium salis TaxID=1667022 RepID=UPI00374D55E3
MREAAKKTNVIGNIDLSNKDDFQAIYASQLYGTFFMIFARFTANSRKAKGGYTFRKIELRLFNYKGLINIGLKRARYVIIKNSKSEVIGGKIIVEVEGNSNKFYLKRVSDVYGKHCQISNKIEVDRRLARLHSTSPLIRHKVFDNEFYYREGVEPEEKKPPYDLNKVKVKFENRKPLPNEDYYDDGFGSGQGGLICPRSQNIIIR